MNLLCICSDFFNVICRLYRALSGLFTYFRFYKHGIMINLYFSKKNICLLSHIINCRIWFYIINCIRYVFIFRDWIVGWNTNEPDTFKYLFNKWTETNISTSTCWVMYQHLFVLKPLTLFELNKQCKNIVNLRSVILIFSLQPKHKVSTYTIGI